MTEGLFITFEGVDGCGKSLMQQMTGEWLTAAGYDILLTREPGGSDLGRSFRAMLLDSGYGSLDAATETLLFMVDRSRHVGEIIAPALAAGKIVLCDRYTDSTLAYQGGGRGLDIEKLAALNDFAAQGTLPRLTLWLDIPVDRAMQRLCGEKDRLEQEDEAFFQRVAAVYGDLARKEPQRFCRIDASLDVEQVFAQVRAAIMPLLPGGGPSHE